LINGFVGFQLYEDGTTLSVWLLRLCSLAMFVVSGAVSLLTFKNWAGLSAKNPIGIMIVTYIVNAIFLFVYVASQIILVLGTLEDRWPLGDISFGVFFFVIGQVILYVFSDTICDSVQHYLDGLFFATICNLLAVMMVYKVSSPPRIRSPNCANVTENSTGIPLPARISSSQSVSRHTTGKSKNSYQKEKTSEELSTNSPSTSLHCTSSHTTAATHTTRTSVTNVLPRWTFYLVIFCCRVIRLRLTT
jgi:hypothetical protein